MFHAPLQFVLDFLMEYGALGLFIFSFIEAFFFPVPPDVMLIALSLIHPQHALWYALITTAASILGGLFGYWIGLKAGRPILKRFVAEKLVFKAEDLLRKYGGWAVVIAGLTPIPYKIFTITAGLFRIKVLVFLFASLIGRGIRFFFEGILLYFLGAEAQAFIYRYFEEITIGMALIFVCVFGFMKIYVWKKRPKSSAP